MRRLPRRKVIGWWMLVVYLTFFCSFPALGEEKPQNPEFQSLSQRLVQDGFDAGKITTLFAKKAVSFTPSSVSLFFVHSESSLDYDQFMSKKSIANAVKYMETYKEILNKAQTVYGVDKTVITAILLVETRLGSYLGKRTVINTLATMAALTDDALQERIWKAIPANKQPKKQTFEKKVQKRIKWGYEELKALIKYTDREGIEPESLKGSYAGAMGIPQFLPSNALTLAKDGNGDGKVNLFDHADAIFSVANYLKHHGWKPGITRQRQHKVLFSYNHSNYYVDTLLKISDTLKEG